MTKTEGVCVECGLPTEPTPEDIRKMENAALRACADHMRAREEHKTAGLSSIGYMIYAAALTLTQERAQWEKDHERSRSH
jgi:hypothetical protein